MWVDIKKNKPSSEHGYFVDTNVWYWATYAASKTFYGNAPRDYQILHYPEFIQDALDVKAKLYYSPLVLVELSSLIENSELGIYRALNSSPKFPIKNFRGIEAERKAVLNEIDNAWAQVKGMAEPLPLGVGEKVDDSVMGLIRDFKIDGYDALYCHFMKESGVTNILSDDKDFRYVGGLSLYSCYEK